MGVSIHYLGRGDVVRGRGQFFQIPVRHLRYRSGAPVPKQVQPTGQQSWRHQKFWRRRFGPDPPDIFGADEFCMSCQLCTKTCPVDAIQPAKQTVRGAEKWYVDFDKCILFFVEHNGCAMCLPACPWSRPGVAPRLADKMSRRADQ